MGWPPLTELVAAILPIKIVWQTHSPKNPLTSPQLCGILVGR